MVYCKYQRLKTLQEKLKLISWNIKMGSEPASQKVLRAFKKLDADIFVSRNKMSGKSGETGTSGYYLVLEFLVIGKECWNRSDIYQAGEPMNVVNGIGIEERTIKRTRDHPTLEFENICLTVYPNSQVS